MVAKVSCAVDHGGLPCPGYPHPIEADNSLPWYWDETNGRGTNEIKVRQDIGGPYEILKKVTLVLQPDGSVRWKDKR